MSALRVAVLGSTGAIGRQALKVMALHPDRFRIVALAAGRQRDRLLRQIAEFRPKYASLAEGDLDASVLPIGGGNALAEMASLPDVDAVLVAVTGFQGLPAVLAALGAGKRVLLANKEPLVAAGPLVMDAAARSSGSLYPVDSEHSAIFQCLRGQCNQTPRRIVLTASGGPFRGKKRAEMAGVTPAMALRHPSWSMGPKITVDSATMMNKALETVEARWLFGVPGERIDVLVHPQSVLHSMVEFEDGSCIAQLGEPDMRVPILYALGCPERLKSGVPFLDLAARGSLTFEAPDPEAFPALRLAREALRRGGLAPCAMNAANEVAVDAFLRERIPFLRIAELAGEVMAETPHLPAPSLEDVFAADADARARTLCRIGG